MISLWLKLAYLLNRDNAKLSSLKWLLILKILTFWIVTQFEINQDSIINNLEVCYILVYVVLYIYMCGVFYAYVISVCMYM